MTRSQRRKAWWTGVVLVAVAAGLAGYFTSRHQTFPAPVGYPVLVPQVAGPADSATIQGLWTWPPDPHGAESYWDLRQDGPIVHGAYRWNTGTDVREVEGRVSPTGAVVLRDVGADAAAARYEGQLASDGVIRGVQIREGKRYVWSLRPGASPSAISSPPVPGEPVDVYARAADTTAFGEYLEEQRSEGSERDDDGPSEGESGEFTATPGPSLTGTWRGVMRDQDDRGEVTMSLQDEGGDVEGTATIHDPTTGGDSNLSVSGRHENGRFSGFLTGRVDTCNVHLTIHATVRANRQIGSFSGTNSCSPSGYAGTLELIRE